MHDASIREGEKWKEGGGGGKRRRIKRGRNLRLISGTEYRKDEGRIVANESKSGVGGGGGEGKG